MDPLNDVYAGVAVSQIAIKILGEQLGEMSFDGVNSTGIHKLKDNDSTPLSDVKRCIGGFCSSKCEILTFLTVSTILLGLYFIFFILPPTFISSVSHTGAKINMYCVSGVTSNGR